MFDLFFETSWEVCNKVGGIYAVLSTKAKTLQTEHKDKVIFIGPDMGEDNPFPLDEKKYDSKKKLALEMFYMGAYISEHPLDKFPYIDLDSLNNNEKVRIGGIVTEINKKKTKNGKDYLNIKFKAKDDIERATNIFNEEKVKSLSIDLKKGQIIVITGNYSSIYHNINAVDLKIMLDKEQLLKRQNANNDQQQVIVQDDNKAPDFTVPKEQFSDIFNMP
jgi:DNA polymerase III alpha subunit